MASRNSAWWLGVLARGFSVIPSLVQLAFTEMFATAPLGAGVLARIADRMGWNGTPSLPPLTFGVFGYAAFGSFFLWLVMRDIWNPGVREVRWSPVQHFGVLDVVSVGGRGSVRYAFLGSHPSYVLMDLFALTIPLSLVIYSWGDDTQHNPAAGVARWWLVLGAAIPILRLFCWYVLRRGPNVIAAVLGPKATARERLAFEWRQFWSGPLVFWAMVIALLFLAWFFAASG